MIANRMNDLLFKNIFGRPERKRILLNLVNSVLSDGDDTDVIADLELIDRELDPKKAYEKTYRLDILGKTADGTVVNIEVQTTDQRDIDKRSLCYWARLYGNQLDTGKKYSQLCPAIMINILSFSYFEGTEYHNVYQIRNTRTGKPLNSDLQIHFIEIPKWDNLSRNAKNRLERWLEFISNKKPKEVEEIAMTDTAIKEALEAEKEFFSSEESRYLYDMRQKALWDYESGMYSARQEGREEGREEGRKEGRAEGRAEGVEEGEARGIVKGRAEERMTIAKSLIQDHFPIGAIKKSLNLTDEEVKKLLS